MISALDLWASGPFLVLVLAAGAVLLLTVAGPAPRLSDSGHLALLGAGALGGVGLWLLNLEAPAAAFQGALIWDGQARLFGALATSGAALSLVLALPALVAHGLAVGEFVALVLLASVGMLMMVAAGDLLVFFMGLEILSIAAYVLAGFRRGARRSQEAALKYFVYGGFASAFLLYGMALIFGEVGRASGQPSLNFVALSEALTSGSLGPLLWAGATLVLLGLAFKLALVPFHMWAPDVYDGAPTPAVAFMAVGVKVAAFAGLCRFAGAIAPVGAPLHASFVQLLQLLAMLSMLGGNLLALRQRLLKRFLAYSSIAHAGYALIAVVAHLRDPRGEALVALAVYMLAYSAMTLGAFGVVMAIEGPDISRVDLGLERLRGMAQRQPALALAFCIFLLSLAGLPPLAGFAGKFALLRVAVAADQLPLAAVALLASLIGAAGYLKLFAAALLARPGPEEPPLKALWLSFGLIACALLTLGQGLMPEPFWQLARRTLGMD